MRETMIPELILLVSSSKQTHGEKVHAAWDRASSGIAARDFNKHIFGDLILNLIIDVVSNPNFTFDDQLVMCN